MKRLIALAKKMSKKEIPKSSIIDILKSLFRSVFRITIIILTLILLFIVGFYAYERYVSWNNELVILAAIKCGPNIVDPSKFSQEKIISFRGTRKNKEILNLVELIPKSVIKSDNFSDWKERYGYEWQPKDVQITRDYYITKKKLEHGKEIVSYNRKNLQREYKKYIGTLLEDESTRQCRVISVKEYNTELESVRKLFLKGNKI